MKTPKFITYILNLFSTKSPKLVIMDDTLTLHTAEGLMIKIDPQSDISTKKLTKIMIMLEQGRQCTNGPLDVVEYVERHRLEDHVRIVKTDLEKE